MIFHEKMHLIEKKKVSINKTVFYNLTLHYLRAHLSIVINLITLGINCFEMFSSEFEQSSNFKICMCRESGAVHSYTNQIEIEQ